jgi:uncharacterized protein YkwD
MRLLALGATKKRALHFTCMIARMVVADEVRARGTRRASGARALSVLAALVAFGQSALGDPVAVINVLRTEGCSDAPAVGTAVRRDSALDVAARELARGADLGTALARVAYPVASSTSFHVRGSRDDAAIRGVLAERSCVQINDAKYSELGVHQSGADTWIVMAGRAAIPFAALQDPAAVAQRVLELTNAARVETRQCGPDRQSAAAPLTLSTTLTAVASLHSLDMAERGSLGHDGSDGSAVGDRVTRYGYAWAASGENVAAGQADPAGVVAAWLGSPGHCATVMEPRFTEMGIAFALAPGKNPAVYWTQVFATPR